MDLGIDDDVARQHWPRLQADDFVETSPLDSSYNCAAWAAEDTANWWWPSGERWAHWPAGAPRETTIEAFEAAYATAGYQRCHSSQVEPGFQKIAVYANSSGEPLHVARQLASGRWTSKLGELKDIDHRSLDDLTGPFYGSPALFMRRATSAG